MIDTHCHLTYAGLAERIDNVIVAAAARGVDRMISVGTTPDDSAAAVALADRFDNVYATAGLHPNHADEVADLAEAKDRLRGLLNEPRVVAVGEMGFDRHYDRAGLDRQRAVFAAQLDLMEEFPELPGVIHNREATDDTLGLLAERGLPGERFVFHCFTGSAPELEAILATGAMVSFTGITTFKGAAAVAEASDLVPLERLMIETDSPFLTPAPHRKVKTNEPKYVRRVAEFLAERRGLSLEAFAAAVDANAERFFRLPASGPSA